MVFGSGVGFSGSANITVQLSKLKNLRWRLTGILDMQNGYNFATGLPIDVMLVIGFRLSLDFFARGLHTRSAVAHDPCVS